MSNRPTIRRATEQDVPEILALIKELADFEKCPERVLATEASLLKTLSFPSSSSSSSSSGAPTQGYAHTFLITVPSEGGAQSEEAVAGLALYFFNYSTWLAAPGVYLEDLFVRPAFRRSGFATLLLRRMAQEAREVSGGVGRLEWSCLRWNRGALDFYERMGGEQMNEWVGIRVEGARLEKLADGP